MSMLKTRTSNRMTWIVLSVLLMTGALSHADLINHWKFDETNGVTTAADSAGALNATLHGDAVMTNDATRGQVLELGGTVSDYADNSSVPFIGAIDHTVALWVNHHDSGSFDGIWLSWGTSVPSGTPGKRFFLGPHTANSGKVFVGLAGTTQYFSDYDADPLQNTWEHWAFVREGSQLRLYRNGELVEVGTNNITGVIGTDSGLQIGRSYDVKASLYGRMDDLAIWNEPLTQDEIQSVMILGAENYSEPILSNHWKFNETNGVTAADSAGELPVTLMNGAAFAMDTTRGQVLELDGNNDFATNPGEPFTNDMTHTVSLWAKHDASPPFSAGWLSWGSSLTAPSARYFILPFRDYGRSGKVCVGIGQGDMIEYTVADALPVSGEWQYWTFVRNLEKSEARLYLNGVLIETVKDLNNGGGISTNGALRIGADSDPGVDYHFDGQIDDVAIWKKALNSAEIWNAMQLGAENFDQPLLRPLELRHNWKFNENEAAAEAVDSTGDLHATLRNGAVITNDVTRGRVLALDGVDDYADHAAGVPLSADINHTVAVWIKHPDGGSSHGFWLSWGKYPDGRYFLGPNNVNSGRIIFAVGGDAYQRFYDSDASPVPDTWQHWAFVREGRQARLYLNGVLIETRTKDNGNAIVVGDGLQIGRSFEKNTNLNGMMDDLAIWQGSLSVEQIQNVMDYGAEYYEGSPMGTLITIR